MPQLQPISIKNVPKLWNQKCNATDVGDAIKKQRRHKKRQKETEVESEVDFNNGPLKLNKRWPIKGYPMNKDSKHIKSS